MVASVNSGNNPPGRLALEFRTSIQTVCVRHQMSRLMPIQQLATRSIVQQAQTVLAVVLLVVQVAG